MEILLKYADENIEISSKRLVIKDQLNNIVVVINENKAIVNYPDTYKATSDSLEVVLMDFE